MGTRAQQSFPLLDRGTLLPAKEPTMVLKHLAAGWLKERINVPCAMSQKHVNLNISTGPRILNEKWALLAITGPWEGRCLRGLWMQSSTEKKSVFAGWFICHVH